MKKLFIFLAAIVAAMTVSAARQTVWTGDEAISWNSESYSGSQYEMDASNFSNLIKGDTLYITVTTPESYADPQYVMTFKAGPSWKWTDLPVTVEDGLISYVIAADSIGKQIAERGLVFRGIGYHITKVVVATVEDSPKWEETIVWSVDEPIAISWDDTSWPGKKFDTSEESVTLPNFAVDDQIRVYISSSLDGAQYSLQYKDGEGWTWTNLDFGTRDNIMRITITSTEVGTFIKDRGLVVSGIKYYINKIAVFAPKKSGPTAVENVNVNAKGVKVLRDGIMYIQRGETLYNMQGQIVK